MTDDRKDDDEAYPLVLTAAHLEVADAIVKLLKEQAASPGDGCLALVAAHVKLWAQYSADTDTMLMRYIRDFFALTRAIRDEPPSSPPPDVVRH